MGLGRFVSMLGVDDRSYYILVELYFMTQDSTMTSSDKKSI